MNRKLVTLAVAAAMAAPTAALAEATIYGKLHQSIDYVDVEHNAYAFGPQTKPSANVPVNSTQLQADTLQAFDATGTAVSGTFDSLPSTFDLTGVPVSIDILSGMTVNGVEYPATEDFKGWDLNANSRSNRVGIKGSEDLGGGLKAIYQVELNVRLADADGDIDNGDRGRLQFRNSFVGLAGQFGTFLVGRHDTPLKISTGKLDLFADTLADYNHTIGFHDVRADNTIAYISPNFAGFQFMGAVIPSGGATPLGWGDAGESPEGIADAWSVAGIYKNGPFYAGLGYESLGSEHWASTLDSSAVDADGITRQNYRGVPNYGTADDWNKWRIGLGLLDWNGFTLNGIYEAHSNVLGAPKRSDMDIWQIQAAYAFGNNTIKAMYGQNDSEDCVGAYASTCAAAVTSAFQLPATDVAFLNQRDHDSWAVAFDHNFSKRTRAYLLYTATDSDQNDSDWSGFSLGMIHKF